MTADPIAADVLIVGAGIAGAGAAYFLALSGARVHLLEQEWQPGYHSTGRSAALFTETYGNAPTRALTSASRAFLAEPPPGFAPHRLLSPRGFLVVGPADAEHELRRSLAEFRALTPSVRWVDQSEALAMVPVLQPQAAAAALIEPDAMDIDVHALHQGYLRGATSAGAKVTCDAPVTAIARAHGTWAVETPVGRFRAPMLVNACGAWADELARLASLAPLGLTPKRRTMIAFDPPAGVAADHWPMVIAADESWYLKADAGRLLGSPADETPSPACDIQPDELDIAITVDRIERATTLTVRRIVSKWAGLRVFAPDKSLIAGFDPDAEGFFWLAGQGGYGIQTSPAMGRIAAAMIGGGRFPDDIARFGASPEALDPARLRKR